MDALASNNGHLLWSGIVEQSKAKAIAAHLLGPRLFSGWGVRTLAEGEGRYNPIGYHVGTVWPFDTSVRSPGDYAATASRRRPPFSPTGSSTRPSCSAGAFRRRSAVTSAASRSTPCSTPRRAALRRGRRELRCSSCGRCSGSSPWATTSSSTRGSLRASASWRYSTFPDAGAASTPSRAGAPRWACATERGLDVSRADRAARRPRRTSVSVNQLLEKQ